MIKHTEMEKQNLKRTHIDLYQDKATQQDFYISWQTKQIKHHFSQPVHQTHQENYFITIPGPLNNIYSADKTCALMYTFIQARWTTIIPRQVPKNTNVT